MALFSKVKLTYVVSMSEISFRRFVPTDAQWVVARHADLYARDEGFDDTFGAVVGEIIADFCRSHDPLCEQGWIAETQGQRIGCIFCVRHTDTIAKLRLFLLTPEARGRGVGKQLLQRCMAYAKTAGYSEMTLWTHESHRAACALYAAFGWQVVDSRPVHSFGVDLVEQTWKVLL